MLFFTLPPERKFRVDIAMLSGVFRVSKWSETVHFVRDFLWF